MRSGLRGQLHTDGVVATAGTNRFVRRRTISRYLATDRYLSRGGTVDAAVLPRLACATSGIALTTVGC